MNVRLRKLVGGALVLTLVMAAGSAIASNGDASADQNGVGATPALGDAVETLEPAAREQWPESFAGLWIDQTAGGSVESVSIAFTEDAENRVARLGEDFPKPELLRAVTFEHSIAELEARQMEMIADREEAREGTMDLAGVPGAHYNLSIDVKRNAIEATVKDLSSEARASFEAEYGTDVLVKQGRLGKPMCVRSNCPPNLRAGLRTNPASGGWCTMAFTVRVPSTGNRNVLSAGHCGPVNEVHRHMGNYGVVRGSRVNGRVDAMRIGPPYSGYFMVPRLFLDNNQVWIPIQSRSAWDGLALGSRACKSGATSGKSCGPVTGKHESPWWVPNANRFVRVDNCAQGGDSGSPVVREDTPQKAHGILSGGVACPFLGSHTVSGHIEYALDWFNVTLVTL